MRDEIGKTGKAGPQVGRVRFPRLFPPRDEVIARNAKKRATRLAVRAVREQAELGSTCAEAAEVKAKIAQGRLLASQMDPEEAKPILKELDQAEAIIREGMAGPCGLPSRAPRREEK